MKFPHLAFSKGSYYCPGRWLGKMEAEAAVAELLERLPNVRLDPDMPQPVFCGAVTRSIQADSRAVRC